jgi:hypothetical protein
MTKQIIAVLPRVASLALSLLAASTANSAKGEASSGLAGSTWRFAESSLLAKGRALSPMCLLELRRKTIWT